MTDSQSQQSRFKYVNSSEMQENNDQPNKEVNKYKIKLFKLDDQEGQMSNAQIQPPKISNNKFQIEASPNNDESNIISSQITPTQQISEEERQKDRQIRKLTNINKHLIQLLKEQNDELSKRVQKQKFRIPKKNHHLIQKNEPKNTIKQIESFRKELQNCYKQIDFYKQTLSILKAKQIPFEQQQKINDHLNKLKQKNDVIEKIQKQFLTQKSIKLKQDKELGKVQNPEITQITKKLQQQILSSKNKLKEVKKNLSKRQELEKKQHLYFGEIELLLRRLKKQEGEKQQQELRNNSIIQQNKNPTPHQQISEVQWKQLRQKLAIQKKKYEDNGKKFTYLNYMKSKQNKLNEELELKYKQKLKIFEKLKLKLNQVDKLSKIRPKPQIQERVDLKMEKLKDIISRQGKIQLSKGGVKRNIIQFKSNSQDVRHFKKWHLEHLQNENSQIGEINDTNNQEELNL